MDATVDHLRQYAHLPSEVPTGLLEEHLAVALRDLRRDAEVGAAPEGLDGEWEEAHTVRALASVLPHLHTFTLDGSFKVARLQGTEIGMKWVEGAEASRRTRELGARYRDLIAVLKPDPNPFDPQVIG